MTESDSQSDPLAAAFAIYPEIEAMYGEFSTFREELRPSPEWQETNKERLKNLAKYRYQNFKQILAFESAAHGDATVPGEIASLARDAGFLRSLRALTRSCSGPRIATLGRWRSARYRLLTRLLWAHVEKTDSDGNLDRLSEPLEGNPPRIMRKDRLISRDLALSLLEYRTIVANTAGAAEIRTCLELCSGYGRSAYVFLALRPGCRYILVDTPPALYVAERYLSNVFAERKIFGFRQFTDFNTVREDFEVAEIIFLTPNQLELLPDNSVDLSVSVSSFHEMRMAQIGYYFSELERLTRKFFYLKQRAGSTAAAEQTTIRESDYPVGEDWTLLLEQRCDMQPGLIEALYMLPGASNSRPVEPISVETT